MVHVPADKVIPAGLPSPRRGDHDATHATPIVLPGHGHRVDPQPLEILPRRLVGELHEKLLCGRTVPVESILSTLSLRFTLIMRQNKRNNS